MGQENHYKRLLLFMYFVNTSEILLVVKKYVSKNQFLIIITQDVQKMCKNRYLSISKFNDKKIIPVNKNAHNIYYNTLCKKERKSKTKKLLSKSTFYRQKI